MRIVNSPDEHYLVSIAMDMPGPGGAHHSYEIGTPAGTLAGFQFQNGPIKEVGINGITHESLLLIVKHRLEAFQAGPFACHENAMALQGVEAALLWLNARTADRQKRGVEGESKT